VVTYFPFCALTRSSITGVFLRILQRAKLELLQKLRYIIRYFFIEASNGYVTFERSVTRSGSGTVTYKIRERTLRILIHFLINTGV
jgi:hypothetical protein